LSDGDDPARDEEWQAGVDAANAAGIPVYTVGTGDPVNGGVIPLETRPLRHDGKEVRTKLEETVLRAIADRTGGLYFAAKLKPIAAGSLYLDAIAARPERDGDENSLPVNHDRSTGFYGASLGLLAASILHGIPLSRLRRKS
jgi:Ca-activated chloride channel family protein